MSQDDPLVIQSQIDNIDQMIASGVSRTSYNGKSAEMRSMEELLQARDILVDRLNKRTQVRTVRTTTRGDKAL